MDVIVALLNFADKKLADMVAFEVDFIGTAVVVLQAYYRPLQQRLGDLRVHYQQIYHVERLEDDAFVLVHVADRSEGEVALFFTRFCGLFDELEVDAGPLPAHEVAVVGHRVGVFDVELDAGDVLHAYHIPCSVELNVALVFVLLIVLLHASYLLLLFTELLCLRLQLGQLVFAIFHIFLDGFEFVRAEGGQHLFLHKDSDRILSIVNASSLDISEKIFLLFTVLRVFEG